MGKTRVMVVEDESIVAKNIQTRLKQLGYLVPATVSSGEEALEEIDNIRPNLVLMDIVLDGKMDGVETAEIIYNKYKIPVVYLTAYADDETLERAKKSIPYGYIVKPFEINELRSAIEIALNNYNSQLESRKRSERLESSFNSLETSILVIDSEGKINFANTQSEISLNSNRERLIGQEFRAIFKIPEGYTIQDLYNNNYIHTELTSSSNTSLPVCIDCNPIRNENGIVIGSLIRFNISTDINLDPCIKLNKGIQDTTTQKQPISIGIVAYPRLVVEGLRYIIEKEKDFKILFEETSVSNLLNGINYHKPEILCIETTIPDLEINSILEYLERNSLNCKVILIQNKFNQSYLINSLMSGVKGCLTNNSESLQLVEAIRTVYNGNIWLEIETLNQLLPKLLINSKKRKYSFSDHNLTRREEEVAKLILRGNSNKKISKKLYITEKTVKTHLTKIFKKLGIRNRLELAVKFNPSIQ